MKTHRADADDDRRILHALQDKGGIVDKETAGLIVERMREVLGPAVFRYRKILGLTPWRRSGLSHCFMPAGRPARKRG